uniref:Cytochrome P450 n=1 Tax=Timema genevievae TaxID=629358 RepID=A0A7R9PP83_TIMGE|nr:unnamed protein product [Timema genevievae]
MRSLTSLATQPFAHTLASLATQSLSRSFALVMGTIEKKKLNTTQQDLNLSLSVIENTVYCESNAVDHVNTETNQQPPQGTMSDLFLWEILLLLLGTLTAIFWWSRRDLRRHIDKIPGPSSTPLVGNLCCLSRQGLNLFHDVARRHPGLGPTCKLWLGPKPVVVLTDPVDVQLALNNWNCHDKMFLYGSTRNFLGDGLSDASFNRHVPYRTLIEQAFTSGMFLQSLDLYNRKCRVLVEECLSKYKDGREFDVLDDLQMCTLDIATQYALGIDLNVQKKNDLKTFESVKTMISCIQASMFSPLCWFRRIASFTSLGRRYKGASKQLLDLVDKIIINKVCQNGPLDLGVLLEKPGKDFVPGKRPLGLVDILVGVYQHKGITTSVDEIRREAVSLLLNGFETTSLASAAVLKLLSHHVEVQDRVREELVGVLGVSRVRPLTFQQLQRMTYLDQVIKETLRLYPCGPPVVREVMFNVHTAAYTIPKGASLVVLPYFTHRNPVNYGNPEKFDPDRFSPERGEGRHPWSFLPFSGGARGCVAQEQAMLQLKIVLASVLRKYRVLPVGGPEELQEVDCYFTVKLRRGYKIRLQSHHPRNSV